MRQRLAMLSLSRALWRDGHTARAQEVGAEADSASRIRSRIRISCSHTAGMAALDALGGQVGGRRLPGPKKGSSWPARSAVETSFGTCRCEASRASDLGDPGGVDDVRCRLSRSPSSSDCRSRIRRSRMGNLGEFVSIVESVAPAESSGRRVVEFAQSRGHATSRDVDSRRNSCWHLLHEGQVGRPLARGRRARRVGSRAGRYSDRRRRPRILSAARASRNVVERRRHARLTSEALPRAREVGDPQSASLPALALAAFVELAGGDSATAPTRCLTEYDASRGGAGDARHRA